MSANYQASRTCTSSGMETNARDVELTVTDGQVTAKCVHCDWSAVIAQAPYGVDLVRYARKEAFNHCFEQHGIHAWDVKFGHVG